VPVLLYGFGLKFSDFLFKIILSAYAEDDGLCPWMNADSVEKPLLCRWVHATADSAAGGQPSEALAGGISGGTGAAELSRDLPAEIAMVELTC
jgi:hypothetical protein